MTATLLPPELAETEASPSAGADALPGGPAPAIRTSGLTKRYGGLTAVTGLSIEIPRGVVAGFVGPNGSGKTTTIRMILSMIRPTEGNAEVLGVDTRHPIGYLPRVGALIEGPAFYPTLSGRRNLRVLSSLGGYSPVRVEEVLEIVGLADRAGDHVASYSMGMKQRLGIAAALLPKPELLVLDEPANGLDPAGILEMRRLILELSRQGVTVFISSHLLAEVEQIADWIVMLNKGRLLFQGPIDAVLSQRATQLVVAAEDPADLGRLAALLRSAGHGAHVIDGRLHIDAEASFAAELNRSAMSAGITLVEIGTNRATLEDTFLAMTAGETR
jgi:ABC-2 type transport system ATP-binding protein